MTADARPYVGLRPFTEDESLIFFGRDQDTEGLLNRIYASRSVVVFAPSGVGKTSLLRAGVLKELRQDSLVFPVYINDWTRPLMGQLITAMESFRPEALKPTPGMTDHDRPGLAAGRSSAEAQASLLTLTRDFRARTHVRPILILDQFEEVLRYHSNRGMIWDQLAPLMNALNQPARVVLSLREDYLGILDELMNRVPGLMESRYRVQPLTLDGIRDAIRRPLEIINPPFAIEPALEARIVEDFEARRHEAGSDGRIEAGYLQLVCQRLWEVEKDNPERALRLTTYEAEGGIDWIVESHVNRSLAGCLNEKQRHLLYAMIRYLVTPTGAKVALSVPDLAELIRETDLSVVGRKAIREEIPSPLTESLFKTPEGEESITEVAERLCQADILMLRRKEFRKRISYELCHDVLGSVLLRWRSGINELEAQKAKQEAEAARLAREEAERAQHAAEQALQETRERWMGIAVSCLSIGVVSGLGTGWLAYRFFESGLTPWIYLDVALVGILIGETGVHTLRSRSKIGRWVLSLPFSTLVRQVQRLLRARHWSVVVVEALGATVLALAAAFDAYWTAAQGFGDRSIFIHEAVKSSEPLAFLLRFFVSHWPLVLWLVAIGFGVHRMLFGRRKVVRWIAGGYAGLSLIRWVIGLLTMETESWNSLTTMPVYGPADALLIVALRNGGACWLVFLLIRWVIRRFKELRSERAAAKPADGKAATR